MSPSPSQAAVLTSPPFAINSTNTIRSLELQSFQRPDLSARVAETTSTTSVEGLHAQIPLTATLGQNAPSPDSISSTTRQQIPNEKLHSFWTASNGIGVIAVVLAMAFGIGAWVGMNMQYNQGAKSLELTIWATCADHENIQGTNLCRDILGKSFDQFHGRSEVVSLHRRENTEKTEVPVAIENADVFPASGSLKRRMITQPNEMVNYPDNKPDIRGTIQPMVDLLHLPDQWSLLIGSLLITVASASLKLLAWLATAIWFCFQIWVYIKIEGLLKVMQNTSDSRIVEVVFPTVVAASALKSCCFHDARFFESMKVIGVWRVGIWISVYLLDSLAIILNFCWPLLHWLGSILKIFCIFCWAFWTGWRSHGTLPRTETGRRGLRLPLLF